MLNIIHRIFSMLFRKPTPPTTPAPFTPIIHRKEEEPEPAAAGRFIRDLPQFRRSCARRYRQRQLAFASRRINRAA